MRAKITNLNLFVKDVERAFSFYKTIFGFEEIEDRAARPGFVRLSAGDEGFFLSLQSASGVGKEGEPVGGVEIGIEAQDIPAVIDLLKSAGAEVGEFQQMGWGGAVEARDLDGNRLNIFKRRAAENSGQPAIS